MRILVFDTETTGLPLDNYTNVNMNNVDSWPHIVQFSYIIYNAKTKIVEKIADHIIKIPENIIISPESIALHGITKKRTQSEGTDISPVLNDFFSDRESVNLVVAHNLEFDVKMIQAEYYRVMRSCKTTKEQLVYLNILAEIFKPISKFCCTMRESKDICNIIAKRHDNTEYTKFPKLSELHQHLFGVVPSKLHNSLNDVIICLRCFYKMRFHKDICEDNTDIQYYIKQLLQYEM